MKRIILGVVVALALVACANHGKKVKIEGTKGEVYYKGEGVTEDDAKKTGEFLKSEGYFNNDRGATTQITKEGDTYTVRFVYKKDVADTLKAIDQLFKGLAYKMSKSVFPGKHVNIALASDQMKDYKTIAWDEAYAKSLEEPATPATDDSQITLTGYDSNELGDIMFYWKDVSDDEAKSIADYIVKNGAFNGGQAKIIISKEGDRFVVKYPVADGTLDNATNVAEFDKVTKEIKDNLFANVPYTFIATDTNLQTLKSWEY